MIAPALREVFLGVGLRDQDGRSAACRRRAFCRRAGAALWTHQPRRGGHRRPPRPAVPACWQQRLGRAGVGPVPLHARGHELDLSHLAITHNQASVRGHVGRFKHWHNPAAPNACRVLNFGDSYAYDANLAAWCALQCRDVYCAWQLGLQQALVEQLAPDAVVSQMAERFVTRLPVDVL